MIGLGLEAVPEAVLHPSTAERFTRCAPGLSGVARRTLRTNLRFIGRRVVPQMYPADLPLPRERAKEPCSPAALRRSTGSSRWRTPSPRLDGGCVAAGLVCLGAGAGLIRGDLRSARPRCRAPLLAPLLQPCQYRQSSWRSGTPTVRPCAWASARPASSPLS